MYRESFGAAAPMARTLAILNAPARSLSGGSGACIARTPEAR